MSLSPPIRRLSAASTSSKREEDLINAYEAEEERIINVLSRKLEKLQEEKIELENVLEAESESHVNRLSRELFALRLAQQSSQMQSQNHLSNGNGIGEPSIEHGRPARSMPSDPLAPSPDIMLEALLRENELLRNRMVDMEREYIRITRLNEIYREELIQHRRRLGLSVDNLIGLSSSHELYSQPTHRRSMSNTSSPAASAPIPLAPHATHPSPSVPIPRPPSQIHRPVNTTSESTTPLSHSPSSASESPYLSPLTSTNPASYISNTTGVTTPPSSTSPTAIANGASRTAPLSYPSVPPPSLSSSFGSPTAYYHGPRRDLSSSPVEGHTNHRSVPRRGNFERRVADSQSLRRSLSRGDSRRESVERGARIAETGQLVPRSRAGSVALGGPSEVVAPVDEHADRT